MSNRELRAILDWWMCSDPWPVTGAADRRNNKELVDNWLDRECKGRHYDGIIDAYHRAPHV
jgi:hypothetical protein